MTSKRLMPYVENDTLEEVIDRFQNRRDEYLLKIADEMRKDNEILLPYFLRAPSPIPLSIGVYELLSLSLLGDEKLPCVTLETMDEIMKSSTAEFSTEENKETFCNLLPNRSKLRGIRRCQSAQSL